MQPPLRSGTGACGEEASLPRNAIHASAWEFRRAAGQECDSKNAHEWERNVKKGRKKFEVLYSIALIYACMKV